MFQSDFTVGQVTDMAGNSVYAPGVTFEIIIKSLNDSGSRTHWFIIGADGTFYEYQLRVITSWGEAFSQTGGSLFYGFFVYPLAFILVGFIRLFSGVNSEGILDSSLSNYGVSTLFAILLTSIFVKGLTLAFTWKSQMNQEKMTTLSAKQAEIQEKYKGSSDPSAKQKQQLELMALYKKEGISPVSSMATQVLTMPFLFGMFVVVRATRALKTAQIGQISLIEQPWAQIRQGNWVYSSLIAVYLPLQILSMLLPILLQLINKNKQKQNEKQRKARKKQLLIQLLFTVVFLFIISTIASGVAIYWIFSSLFQISQTLALHYLKTTKAKRNKNKKAKLIKANKEKSEKAKPKPIDH